MGLFSKKPTPAEAEAAERAFSQLKAPVAGSPQAVLFDDKLGVYQRWYFEFRLREEVARSARYSAPFALMVLILEKGVREDLWPALIARTARALLGAVRSVDLTAVLDPGVFAVCLLNCDHAGAEIAGERIEAALADIPHSIGGALFPEDNLGPEELLKLTRHRASSSAVQRAQYNVTMPSWPVA